MTLNEYQEKAMSTCMGSCDNFSYMMLNLVGEVGEFASKVAKGIRKGDLEVGSTGGESNILLMTESRMENIMNAEVMQMVYKGELMKEAGDILWQLSGLCSTFGWTLEEVAQMNLDKLADRKKRGVIDGNGDNR